MSQIQELNKQGLNHKQIAKQLKISEGKVTYWLNEESRIKMKEKSKKYYHALSKEQKKVLLEKRKEYMRNYFKTRYKSDEKFRQSVRDRQRVYFKQVALNRKSSLGLPVPVSKE
jgi:transposase